MKANSAPRILQLAEQSFTESQSDPESILGEINTIQTWLYLFQWADIKWEHGISFSRRTALWQKIGILYRTKANLANICQRFPSAQRELILPQMTITLLIQQVQKEFTQ